MSNKLFGGLDDLSDEARMHLAAYEETKLELLEHLQKLTARRLEMLRDPTLVNEEELDDYQKLTITPLLMRMNEHMLQLLHDTVDLDKIKGITESTLIGVGALVTMAATSMRGAVQGSVLKSLFGSFEPPSMPEAKSEGPSFKVEDLLGKVKIDDLIGKIDIAKFLGSFGKNKPDEE